MSANLGPLFERLRAILEPYAARLNVSADTPTHYCLDVPFSAKLKKAYPVAWVKTGKNYVSYHLMPVYMFPKLRERMTPELRGRMQGKACFNFRIIDEGLLAELEKLTAEGLKMGREQGFGG